MRRWLLLVLLIGGCTKTETAQKNSVPLDKVPVIAMDAAAKAAKERFPTLSLRVLGGTRREFLRCRKDQNR